MLVALHGEEPARDVVAPQRADALAQVARGRRRERRAPVAGDAELDVRVRERQLGERRAATPPAPSAPIFRNLSRAGVLKNRSRTSIGRAGVARRPRGAA